MRQTSKVGNCYRPKYSNELGFNRAAREQAGTSTTNDEAINVKAS